MPTRISARPPTGSRPSCRISMASRTSRTTPTRVAPNWFSNSIPMQSPARASTRPRSGRTLLLLVDGLVVTDMRDAGEKLEVRVKAVDAEYQDITDILQFRMPTPGRRQHCTGGPGQGQPTAGPGQHPTLQLPPCDHGRGRHRREPDRHRDRQRQSAGSLAAVPCRILLDRPGLLRRTGRHPGKPGCHRDPVRVRHRRDVRHPRHPVPQLLAAVDDPFDRASWHSPASPTACWSPATR